MRSIVRCALRALGAWLPRGASLFVVGVLLAALALVGCGGSSSSNAADETPGGSRFGAGYEILTSPAETAPERPPVLRDDTLVAMVAYEGGEETHDFTLSHETRGDTARLWLRHDAAGEDGSTRVLDDVRLAVPQDALAGASTVVLLNPQGGAPFLLQWPGG